MRPLVAGAINGTCGVSWKDCSHHWSPACSCGYLWVLQGVCASSGEGVAFYARGVFRCVDFPTSGFTVPSRVCPGTMPNSSVQSVAVYHVVQCLLASKEWLLQPGVPGAWPCINMVGHWHCICGNVVAALVAVWCVTLMVTWCLRQWQFCVCVNGRFGVCVSGRRCL